MRIVTFGWYGAGNFGDELLFSLFHRWAELEGATVCAISVDPAFTQMQHGVESVDFHDLVGVAREMQKAHLFALGGGGLFQTYHSLTVPALYDFTLPDVAAYVRPLLMARQFGLATLAWAQGVGPLDTTDGRAIVREVFNRVDVASVRDQGSAVLLERLGVNRAVSVAPDPVWAYPLPACEPKQGAIRKIAVILRAWQSPDDWESKFIDSVAAVPEHAVEWLWIPASWNDVPGRAASDHAFIASMMERLPKHRHRMADVNSTDDVIAAIAESDACIAMRLHGQIVALRCQVPTLCIEYDAKMSVASRDACLDDRARLSIQDDRALWRTRVADLLGGRVGCVPHDVLARLEAEAMKHRQVIAQAVERARSAPSEWQGDVVDWLQLWEQQGREVEARQYGRRLDDVAAALSASTVALSNLAAELSEARAVAAANAERAASVELQLRKREQQLADECRRASSLEQELQMQVQDNAALKRCIDENDHVTLALNSEVRRLTDTIERQSKWSAEALRLRDEHQTTIARLESQLRWADEQRFALHQALQSLDGRLRDIYRSTSWQVTRPLRAVRTSLSGATQAPDVSSLDEISVLLECHSQPGALATKGDLSWPEFEARVLQNRASYHGIFIQEVVIDWNVPLFQRPQHMAAAMARRGYLVIYKTVNWNGDDVDGFREVAPDVWLTNRREVDSIDGVVRSVYSTAYADDPANLVKRPASSVMVYEYIDHIDPQISGDEANIRRLLALKEWGFNDADVVVASARQLEAEVLATVEAERVLFVPNGVDTRHYRSADHATVPLPDPLTRFVASHSAVVGYFGAIAPWLWYEVIEELVQSRPDLGFVFIGPDYYGGCERLPNASNVLQLGAIDYRVLPAYAQLFDVCFIPFAPGEIARSTSPLKLFEYFALEKPVVVSDEMRECTMYPEVFRGGDVASLSAAIDAALVSAADESYRKRLRLLADLNDWDRRAEVMEQAFKRIGQARRGRKANE